MHPLFLLLYSSLFSIPLLLNFCIALTDWKWRGLHIDRSSPIVITHVNEGLGYVPLIICFCSCSPWGKSTYNIAGMSLVFSSSSPCASSHFPFSFLSSLSFSFPLSPLPFTTHVDTSAISYQLEGPSSHKGQDVNWSHSSPLISLSQTKHNEALRNIT